MGLPATPFRSALAALLLALPGPGAPAAADGRDDPLEPYRRVIDDPAAGADDLAYALEGLSGLDTPDVEKPYLLGMLHVRRAIVALREPAVPDAAAAERDFAAAERRYAEVERRSPGYRDVYCKRAELYLQAGNDAGLEAVARRLGEVPQREPVAACKRALVALAERLSGAGRGPLARRIYGAALASWDPYPAPLSEALGDLEGAAGRAEEAAHWWRICGERAAAPGRAARCRRKLADAGSQPSLEAFLEGQDRECYLRYSAVRDHVLVGCPIDGYHADDAVAARADVLLALLPAHTDANTPPPALFLAHTYALGGGSLIRLFEDDLQGLLASRPGTRVVRKILEETPSRMGECAGAELEIPPGEVAFPHQIYLFCRKHSWEYALMVSLLAVSRPALEEHYPHFLRWANVPQHVRDYRVEELGAAR